MLSKEFAAYLLYTYRHTFTEAQKFLLSSKVPVWDRWYLPNIESALEAIASESSIFVPVGIFKDELSDDPQKTIDVLLREGCYKKHLENSWPRYFSYNNLYQNIRSFHNQVLRPSCSLTISRVKPNKMVISFGNSDYCSNFIKACNLSHHRTEYDHEHPRYGHLSISEDSIELVGIIIKGKLIIPFKNRYITHYISELFQIVAENRFEDLGTGLMCDIETWPLNKKMTTERIPNFLHKKEIEDRLYFITWLYKFNTSALNIFPQEIIFQILLFMSLPSDLFSEISKEAKLNVTSFLGIEMYNLYWKNFHYLKDLKFVFFGKTEINLAHGNKTYEMLSNQIERIKNPKDILNLIEYASTLAVFRQGTYNIGDDNLSLSSYLNDIKAKIEQALSEQSKVTPLLQ